MGFSRTVSHPTSRIFPFVDAAEVTPQVLNELGRRCAAFPAFDFRLTQVVPFGEALFVAPEPAQPFRELLHALTDGESPPPYPVTVTVTDTIPHLTVAFSSDPAVLVGH
jgi:hypothetical protein